MGVHFVYEGQHFELPDGTTPEVAVQKIKAHLGIDAPVEPKKEREKTAWYEDLGSGLKDIIDTPVQGGLLALGGIGGVVGSEDFRDAMFEKYTERAQQFRDKEAGLDRGEGGKVLRAVGQIPAYLSPISAAAMIGSGGMKTGADIIEEGGDTEHALTATAADVGSSAAMLALGPMANLSGRVSNAALQGGLNVVQEAGINHPVQSRIRESAGVKPLPDMTVGDFAAAAIPGAAMGATFTKPKVGSNTVNPDLDPELQAVRLPTQDMLDRQRVIHGKAVIDSIEKQIVKLIGQQEELSKNGPMSEKQFEFYKDLEKRIEEKQAEIRKEQGILSKYDEKPEAQNKEELIKAIEDVDIGINTELIKTPKQELVAPETKTQGSMFEFSPDGSRVYLKDRVGAQALYNKLSALKGESTRSISEIAQDLRAAEERYSSLISAGEYGKAKLVAVEKENLKKEFFSAKRNSKQKGSWTPFDDGGEPRPDDSDAPGIMPPWKAREGEHLYTRIRDEVGQKWKQGRGESREAYLDRLDKIAETIYQKKRTQEKQQPTEEDLMRSGIIEGEQTKLPPELDPSLSKWEFESDLDYDTRTANLPLNTGFFGMKTKKTMAGWEVQLKKLKSMAEAVQRRIENDALARSGETVLGKADESAPQRIVKTKDKKTGLARTTFNSDEEMLSSLREQISNLEDKLAKAKQKAIKEDREYIPQKPVRKGVLVSKDSADQFSESGRSDVVFLKPEEKLYQELRNEGKNHQQATEEVWRKFPNDERGMWKPFESLFNKSEDNAKKVTQIFDQYQIDSSTLESPSQLRTRLETGNVPDATSSLLFQAERSLAGRGQFVEANKRAQPIVWEWGKRLKAIKDREIQNKRTWWSGNAENLAAKTLGPFMKLSHYESPETPAHVKAAATNKDKVAISEYMQLASKEHVNHIQEDTSALSPEQRAVLNKFNELTPFQQKSVKIFTDMMEKIRVARKLPYLAGYIPHSRKGDFAVYLKTSQGDPVHLETFTSAKTARAWIEEANKKGLLPSDIVDFKTEQGKTLAESFGLVRDILDSLNSKDPARQVILDKILDSALETVSQNVDIGKHREHFGGITGFTGTKLFKSRLGNAEDFFKSMEEFAQVSAAQHKKVELVREHNKFWDNPDGRWIRDNYPNQSQTADFMFDVAMNKNQKFGWTEHVDSIRNHFDDAYVSMRNKIREVTGKEPDLLYYPDVPILDRATGMGAQLFYISALTTRPGFWIGQALTSPFAVRQFLKEGSIADVMVAQGKGWGTVMTGGDVEWKSFIKDMANKSDSLHPQFINDINALPGISKIGNQRLEKIVEVITGQKPGAMADTFSRYTVAAMAYHHYKQMGMKGDQLASNVRRAIDDTMVMYDREHSPTVFNKMGLVGQNIAPLQKYGIAQLENLIGDLRFIAQRPEGMSRLRAMAPAISTLATTMIMAGSIGLPLLMEYELLRAGFVSVAKFFGWDDVEDYVPGSVLESMMTNENILTQLVSAGYEGVGFDEGTAKDLATHGALSTATGFDIGSSLRFNAYVPGAGENNGSISALSAFPVIKFMADIGSIAMTKIRKHTAGDVTEAEDRAATLKVQPVIGMRAALDHTMFGAGERDYVPGGTRGYAQVEQTGKEQLGQLLGSKPLETSKTLAATQLEMKRDKKMAAMKQKAIDLIVDGITNDNDSKRELGLSMATRAKMTPDQIQEQVKAAQYERRKPRWEDRFQNRKGQIKSTQQKQRAERALKYE